MTDRDYPKIVIPPPGPKAMAVVDRDAAWTSHCYIKEYPLAIARGQGVMVEDIEIVRSYAQPLPLIKNANE